MPPREEGRRGARGGEIAVKKRNMREPALNVNRQFFHTKSFINQIIKL